MKNDEFFPIKTATACPLKWNWSTLYLNIGETYSCHRASSSKLTPDNFMNFHNLPEKISARKKMLEGNWPSSDNNKYDLDYCGFCRKIEDNGGFSDRHYQLTIPNYTPSELKEDASSIVVSPTILEVFFNNTCNLSCNYCSGKISSKIQAEDNKFGNFKKDDVEIIPYNTKRYQEYISYFWKWFEQNGKILKRLNILGGEPFLQKELQQLIDAFESNPNPNCELNLVSNLAVDINIVEEYIEKLKKLCRNKKIKRFDLVCSIDCWGPEQEYVRYGLDLNLWERNFNYVLNEKWIYLCTNSIVTPLTIKTMPHLFSKINDWKKNRKIHQQIGYIQGPDYWKPEIFGGDFYANDIKNILNIMPENNEEECNIKKYMSGILKVVENSKRDDRNIKNFMTFIKEKDRRRNTDYKTVFPWLEEFDVE